jgi:hypothetical protein
MGQNPSGFLSDRTFTAFFVHRAAAPATIRFSPNTSQRHLSFLFQESPVDPDFVFIESYSCPRCHASLEAGVSGPPTWLRCPACGRASLPPEHNRIAPPPYYADERTLLIGNFTTGGALPPLPIRPRAMAPLPLQQAPPTPTARLFLGAGFFLTTLLFIFSLLDSNGGRAGVFGLIAVVCLIFLTRQTGRPREE